MIHITRFIDKVAAVDNKHGNTVVMPISEAKGLCVELTKLLLSLREQETVVTNEPVQVVLTGGAFR